MTRQHDTSRHSPRVRVLCSACGRPLAATAGLTSRKMHVRQHRNPQGAWCQGAWWTDHQPIPEAEAP